RRCEMAEEELGLAATAATGSASTVTNETNETSWAQGLRRSANALGQKTTKTAPNAHYDLFAGDLGDSKPPARGVDDDGDADLGGEAGEPISDTVPLASRPEGMTWLAAETAMYQIERFSNSTCLTLSSERP